MLAGGEGRRLSPLTADRAKPAVPFGGSYRLIDFVLSNFANAGYLKIVVLTQYKSHSLDRHLAQALAAVVDARQLRHARARPDAPGAAVVQRLGRRHLPEPQPHQRREARPRLRVRRRPHLPHGPPPDGRGPSRDGGRRDGRGHPGTAPRRPRVRHHRGRRRRPHLALPREAGRAATDAGRRHPGPGLDGELRVHHRRPRRRRHPDRLVGHDRHRRRRDPGPHRGRGRPPLRLLHQRHPRPARARAGLLARRRHDRRLLRDQHGPAPADAGLQPLQRPVAGLQPAAPAAPGQARLRRGWLPGEGRQQHAVRRLDRLGWNGRPLDPRTRGVRRGRAPRSPTRSSSPVSASARAPASTAASSTRTWSCRRATASASTTGRTATASPSPTRGVVVVAKEQQLG